MPDDLQITLPAMGESVTEGTVARWLKKAGEAVKAGETIAEVTTDKVDVEVPAPADGVLQSIAAPEGTTLGIGGLLATMTAGAQITTPAVPAAPAAAPPAAPAPTATVASSPLERRWQAKGVARGGVGAESNAPVWLEGEIKTLSGPQQTLAEYMEKSRAIPTATTFRTIGVDVLWQRRAQINAALGGKFKISFTHIIAFALCQAAKDVTAMTTHFDHDENGKPSVVQPGIHLGLAVDVERKDGSRFLYVPVIREASELSFSAFHSRYEEMVAKAREGSITADDLHGASFTLTNPGSLGTSASVPRLMPGQGSIIATGAIGFPPGFAAANEEQLHVIGVGRVMTLTSTYDHRVIQGAQSGEFLGLVEKLLAGEANFYQEIATNLGITLPALSTEISPPVSATTAMPSGPVSSETLHAVSAAIALVKNHRTYGHLAAHLDPLGSEPLGDPTLDPKNVNLTEAQMKEVPADILQVYVPGKNMAEVLPNLQEVYSGNIAYQVEYLYNHEQRMWMRERIESGAYRVRFSPERKLQLLRRLTKVDAMERYLRRTFIGHKTFSIEGLDAMVPMLEELLNLIAKDKISQVVMGMSHRGRLAVIAHVCNRTYEDILTSFEQGEQKRAVGAAVTDPTGDVKYHVGAVGTYLTETHEAIQVTMLSNPSHLEAIDPVIEGWTRATQTNREGPTIQLDPMAALPVLIHGDAAFAGEGIVGETLNLAGLQGYSTGGTVHIIANNQIGFTTTPQEGRSTQYASDVARGFDLPVIHVNADDLENCIQAIRLAYDFRRTFHRDVVVDLIGYRRFGHNEADEPSYTQPLMYEVIKNHPTVREIFVKRLIDENLITAEEAEAQSLAVFTRLADAHAKVKEQFEHEPSMEPPELASEPEPEIKTAVSQELLLVLNEQLLRLPSDFAINPKLARQVERRRTSMQAGGIDWGTAESLALSSLLLEGHPVRFTGQDTIRGTFSHRHLAFYDVATGLPYFPIQHIDGARATIEVHNTPLNEMACMGFEYGYSASATEALVLWEAQFGDFSNNAQMIIDQFVASGFAKWGQQSRLTLLLPHGYEGAGPEHSSARIERFLALSAHGNLRVANCSTSAQYFHLLREQAKLTGPHPLVIATPKSLLRLKEASCGLSDLATGHFKTVIDDPTLNNKEEITTLLLCSGKIYYDLSLHPLRTQASDLAIIRLEQLEPVPLEDLIDLVKSYPKVEQMFWVQEEPMNMGAWAHVQRMIGKRRPFEIVWEYVGRPRRASPSEGYLGAHEIEQERIVTTALRMSRKLQAVSTPPDVDALSGVTGTLARGKAERAASSEASVSGAANASTDDPTGNISNQDQEKSKKK